MLVIGPHSEHDYDDSGLLHNVHFDDDNKVTVNVAHDDLCSTGIGTSCLDQLNIFWQVYIWIFNSYV